MEPMDIQRATDLARLMHSGQVDKLGKPYFGHVKAVRDMLTGEDEEVRIIAVLHDVVEDTSMTLDELREHGASERVIAGIDAVTKRPDESYDDLIERARNNADARKVKLADNLHNTMRLPLITDLVTRRRLATKYRRARQILLG